MSGMNWLHWCLYFLAPFAAFAQQSAPGDQQLAVLEGTVIHSVTKAPVRKVRVTLEQFGGKHESALIASTDDAGHFRFVDIKAGRYTLTAQKTGFLDGAYGAIRAGESQSVLNVSSGDQMSDLAIQMFPASMISGQVLDVDGDPMGDINIQLWSQKRVQGKLITSRSRHTSTNEVGEYRISQLFPGTYYINAYTTELQYGTRQISVDKAGKATNLHELTTFYPSSLFLENAQRIHLESGQNQSGINISMQRGSTHSIKGKIATTEDASKYKVFAYSTNGTNQSSDTLKLSSNGDFEFRELPPGKYVLGMSNRGANDGHTLARTEVNVTDQDVTGVTLTPFTPAQIHVRAVLEEEEDKPLINGPLFLNPVSHGENETSVATPNSKNGVYVIDGVIPGTYQIWFSHEKDLYLKSIRLGEQVLNPDAVNVADGATMDVLMVFSKNIAILSGDVELASEDSKTSVRVLFISEERPSELSGFFSAPVDQFLHFSSVQLPPGKYIAFAAEDWDAEAWTDPEFLKLLHAEGIKVELQEKEQKSFRLPLLKKTKTDQVRKQLGIE